VEGDMLVVQFIHYHGSRDIKHLI